VSDAIMPKQVRRRVTLPLCWQRQLTHELFRKDPNHAPPAGCPAGYRPRPGGSVLRTPAWTPPIGRFDPPGLLFFQVGNTRLLLEENAASALIYIQVDEIDATIARLREADVTIESEPHVIFTHEDDGLGPVGMTEWQAFIRDSEGNLVGLASMVPA
jgi:methylmalonyl-CoA/ethylmalonyl-CoA epimerase